MRENRGLMRVYAEQGSGQFLGAELFGPRVEHMAHLLAWALEQKLSVGQMLAMPWYHPVVEEGLRGALRDLNANLKRSEEHTSELQSRPHLVCRLLLEKKKEQASQ